MVLLSGGQIAVSKTTVFSLKPKNFRLTDTGYTYSFLLSPAGAYDDSRVEQSAGRTMLILQPYALNYTTSYKLTIQVFNGAIEEEGALPGEQVITF